jgi:hypothetical protein
MLINEKDLYIYIYIYIYIVSSTPGSLLSTLRYIYILYLLVQEAYLNFKIYIFCIF